MDNDFSFPDAMSGLRAIGSAFGEVVDYGFKVQNQIDTARMNAEDAEFNRFVRSTQLETGKALTMAQADAIRLQAALGRPVNYQSPTGQLISVPGVGKSDSTMLFLTFVGVGIAALAFMRGK